MTSGIHHLHFIPETYVRRNQNPWFIRVKNVLTGRVFENWKEKLLSVGTVYCIINAALCFFTGYWLTSLFQFSLGAFLGILRKEIKDFTNLHKATRNLQKENNEYRLANSEHRTLLNEFKEGLETLTNQNDRYSDNNTLYERHLGTMGQMMTNVAVELETAREEGREVSQEILENALAQFDTTRQTLDIVEANIREANEEQHEKIDKLIKDANQMNHGLFDKIKAAAGRLETINDDLADKKETLASLTREVARLERVGVHVENAAKKNTESAEAVHAAADRLGILFNLKNLDLQKIGDLAVTFTVAGIVIEASKFAFRSYAAA